MNEMQKNEIYNSYNNQMHIWGRILLILSVIMLLSIPFIVGLIYDAMPSGGDFLKGFISVAVIYIPISIVEFLVYVPMLGTGGSYISFITGNVTNLKIPCIMNSRDILGVKDGTPESEVISTISAAASALVTMLVIVAGVILITPLTPILQSETLVPAFDNVVPALFGALGLKYFLKSVKITVIPLVLITLLCILIPSMISQTSILLIPAGGIALLIGFFLFKKGKL